MRKKFLFNNNTNYYTAFANNSIIEIEVEESEKIDRDSTYIGYGKSKNTGEETFQLVKGRDLHSIENSIKRL